MDVGPPEESSIEVEGDGSILRLFRKYGYEKKKYFLVGGISSVFSRVTELVPALVLGIAVDSLFFDTRPFSFPFFPQQLIPSSSFDQLLFAVGLIGGAYYFGAVFSWLNSWSWNIFSQHIQHDIRTDTYDAIQASWIGFFEDKQTGEIMSILNNDVNSLEKFFTDSLNRIIRIIVRVGGMAVIMLVLNWQLALIPIITIPFLAITSYKFVEIIYPKYKDVRSKVGDLNSRLENNIGGIKTVKAYNTETFESQRVKNESKGYLESQLDAVSTRIKFYPVLKTITSTGYLATFLVGGIWVIYGPPMFFTGTLTPGTLVTFLLYSRRFMWPMRQFGRILNDYQYAKAASSRIQGLTNKKQKHIADGTKPIQNIKGKIEYENVDFSYEKEKVLKNINIEIDPKQTVGVVGPTGSGKSTLLKLLMRFYPINTGKITIDNIDIKEIQIDSLRSHIGYVGQDSFLFYGSIKENIAYPPKKQITHKDVVDAAKKAGVHSFIQDLPDLYDTVVGERGVKLSGGQRQRISLARTIIRDPDIYLLDEPTSHVDNKTEEIIQKNLKNIIKDKTTIIVAHRLSTIKDSDKIIVLDQGKIKQRGTHKHLKNKKGLYQNLWNIQTGNSFRTSKQKTKH